MVPGVASIVDALAPRTEEGPDTLGDRRRAVLGNHDEKRTSLQGVEGLARERMALQALDEQRQRARQRMKDADQRPPPVGQHINLGQIAKALAGPRVDPGT